MKGTLLTRTMNNFILVTISFMLLIQQSQSAALLRRIQERLSMSEINYNNNDNNNNDKSDDNISTSSLSRNNDDIDPIVIKGYKFFNSRTGENILIKGIDYYPRPNTGDLNVNSNDFFIEQYRHIWERDILQFQALGVNAIRLYSVDPKEDHSAFMCALSKAGIYALISLASGACPTCAISPSKAPLCYPPELKTRGEAVIKEFSKYSNTLAFSAGNEVNHFVPLGSPPEWNAPCLKKFVRDMRAYVAKCDHIRHIPVGLIMADSDRDENTMYYNCQSNEHDDLEHAEWYGINTYVYCDGNATSFDQSTGFQSLSMSFQSYHYSIPVLLTEFGCLSNSFPTIDGYEGQRNFNQAKWLGLPEVQDEFAGGLAFEYSIEAANAQTPFPFKEFGNQNYGVGYFAPEHCDDIDISCEYKRTPSFYNLKNAYAQAHAMNITMDEFTPTEDRFGRTKCPTQFPKLSSFHWKSDLRFSSFCPPKSHETWTCPATNNSGSTKVPKKVFPSTQSNTSITWLLCGITVMIGIVYILSVKLGWKEKSTIIMNSFNSSSWSDTKKDSDSNSTADDEASSLITSSTHIDYGNVIGDKVE